MDTERVLALLREFREQAAEAVELQRRIRRNEHWYDNPEWKAADSELNQRVVAVRRVVAAVDPTLAENMMPDDDMNSTVWDGPLTAVTRAIGVLEMNEEIDAMLQPQGPQRADSNESSPDSLLSILSKYIAPLATGAAGLAYIFGVWEISRIAEGLGVSSSDFRLEFRDFAVLAAFALSPLLVILVAYPLGLVVGTLVAKRIRDIPWLSALRARYRRVTRAMILGLAALLFLATVYATLFATSAASETVAMLGVYSFACGWIAGRSLEYIWIPVLSLSLLLVAIIFVVGVITPARSWAEDLKEWAATGADPKAQPDSPRGLALVLTPSIGVAWIGSDAECVVKLGDVLIGGETVVVPASLDRFISGQCSPALRPFDG